MGDWQKVKLGDVVRVNPDSVGRDFKYKRILYTDISSVGTATSENPVELNLDEAPSRARRLVKNGDSILSTVRPNRRSFLFIKEPEENWVVSTGFAVLRSGKGIDSRFLYYLVTNQSFTDYLTLHAKGAAYPAVDTQTIEDAIVELPPISEQQKIADILSTYDNLIENNIKRIKILEQMAQELYKEWFVYFRFPGYENVKMVESGTEFGKIPEGWGVKNLGDIMELAYGKALKESDRIVGDIAVYGSSGIVGSHNKKLITGPGIVVGRKGNVGSVYWVDQDFYPIDTTFYVKTSIRLPFIFYLLKRQNFFSGDAAVPGLNRNQAYMNLVLLPKEPFLAKFEEKMIDWFALRWNLIRQMECLCQARDLLLPNLVGGKVAIDYD